MTNKEPREEVHKVKTSVGTKNSDVSSDGVKVQDELEQVDLRGQKIEKEWVEIIKFTNESEDYSFTVRVVEETTGSI